MSKRAVAKRNRVTALLNAISDLHEGDLLDVLKLDSFTQLQDFGDDDSFGLLDGEVVPMLGNLPPPKTLRHRLESGEKLGRVLENHLVSVMVFGECKLPSFEKRPTRREIGGREF